MIINLFNLLYYIIFENNAFRNRDLIFNFSFVYQLAY
jgi:hypothetical protein